MDDIKIAICQNRTGTDKRENIDHACEMIRIAAGNGAKLITLSEIFYYPYELAAIRKIADTDNSTIDRMRNEAASNGVYLCTGSLAIKKGDRFQNTAFLIAPNGEILLEYSKTHLFDVNLCGKIFRESSFIAPGNEINVAKTPIGNIGILICYDIRFPETARTLALKGAEIIIVPAAFNTITGPVHWHVMFRARAIESQVFVLAASQARVPGAVYEAYAHSMAVTPWGDILAEAGETETIVYADLKSGVLENARRNLPLLSQRRPELYNL